MHTCSDNSAFEWIQNGREEPIDRDPNWKGNFVSHLIPMRFEAYAKILNRIAANYENIDNPLTDRELAILKVPPCTELRAFVEKLREQHLGPRIRWRTLAHFLGVPFEHEICHEWFRIRMEEPYCWPRFLYGPDEGTLEAEESSEVISVLRAFTGSQDCFFRFAEMPFIGTDKPILFLGALDELGTFLTRGKYQFTPEYWWPADHTWCLCSDYDLMFTIVGGSKDLISAVLKNANLESLEVISQTRIDSYAPIP
jgi:hypothetical protein